jgi:hypothetical protein
MSKPTKIVVTVFSVKRHDCWIAYCPALKLYGFSEQGEDAALDDFDSAIETFIMVQQQTGKLDETLTTLGWKKHNHAYGVPARSFKSSISPFRGENARTSDRQIPIPAYA